MCPEVMFRRRKSGDITPDLHPRSDPAPRSDALIKCGDLLGLPVCMSVVLMAAHASLPHALHQVHGCASANSARCPLIGQKRKRPARTESSRICTAATQVVERPQQQSPSATNQAVREGHYESPLVKLQVSIQSSWHCASLIYRNGIFARQVRKAPV